MSGQTLVGSAYEVLLVDDDAALLRSLKALLRPAPVSVRCAETAEQALELIREKPPDLLVADFEMGSGMNGLNLVVEAKRHHPLIKGFLLTGVPKIRVPWGVDVPVLPKPCSPEAFLELVLSLARSGKSD